MEFVFVRHGESVLNAQGRYTGGLDAALSPRGRRQAVAASDGLAGRRVDWVVASPLRRARDTADAVAGPHRVLVETDARLVEHCKGVLEGQLRGPLPEGGWESVPGAEPAAELLGRVAEAVSDLAGRDGVGVVVAHAGVARAIECVRSGVPAQRLWGLDQVANGTPVTFRWPRLAASVGDVAAAQGYGWLVPDERPDRRVFLDVAELDEPVVPGERVTFVELGPPWARFAARVERSGM
jgi:probable phosphoglycerate mutase